MTAVASITSDVSFNRVPQPIRERWSVVRDVVSGDNALRTDLYLPMLNATDTSVENVARNKAYRSRAVWYPATQFTLEGLVGLAFHRDPVTELPTELEYLLEDCDGLGVSLYQQSQSVLQNNLAVGRHGLFVDWSEALGHPLIKAYHAEAIINWRYQIVDGKASLVMIVLEEEAEIEDGDWGIVLVKQWREIRLNDAGNVEVRLWREDTGVTKHKRLVSMGTVTNEAGDELLIEAVELRSRGAVLTEIPFTFIGSNNNDASIDPAPLYGLAQLNLAHYRNSADYEDSVFFCGQVQPWISGLTEQWRDYMQNPWVIDSTGERRYTGQKMYIGSRSPLLLPQGASFGMAQAQPNSLAKEAMEHKEAQMVAVGARMIEATKVNKTATGENNDREATTSVLSLCVVNVSEAYQRAIGFCARFLDMKEEDWADAFKIQQDFVQLQANPQLMAELTKSWQSGLLAKNDVRDFFRRLGLIATERSNDDIEKDVEAEEPLGTMGLPPPGTLPGVPGASPLAAVAGPPPQLPGKPKPPAGPPPPVERRARARAR
jgi:hypothetical protein